MRVECTLAYKLSAFVKYTLTFRTKNMLHACKYIYIYIYIYNLNKNIHKRELLQNSKVTAEHQGT